MSVHVEGDAVGRHEADGRCLVRRTTLDADGRRVDDRSDLLRQLDELRREIQQAEVQGTAQLDELQQRHIALGQQIADLRRQERELASG